MPINLTADQRKEYEQAFQLAEGESKQSSPQLEKARDEIAHSTLSPETAQFLARYLQLNKSVRGGGGVGVFSGSEFFTSGLRADKGAVASLPPIDTGSPDIERIKQHGIQTDADIQVALRYVQTIAPEFGGEIVKGYQAASEFIKISIDPSVKGDGSTSVLSVSYFDRNERYFREIKLSPGTELTTLVHELIHALPKDLQPKILRDRLYPVASKQSSFREIRDQSQIILIHEEAEAFSAECIVAEEAERNGHPIEFKAPLMAEVYDAYKREGIEGVGKVIASTQYREQAKVVSIVTALAGKLGKEKDPRFSPRGFLDLISEATGEGVRDNVGAINPTKAAKALYELFKDAFPEQNSLEVFVGVAREALKTGNPQEAALEALVQAMEARFDGPQAYLNPAELAQKLENSPDLGPRRKPVDTRKDRGHLNDPEMAKVTISGWADYIRYLERLKNDKKIGERRFAQTQLQLAEFAPDPMAGKLFGQATILAYSQADRHPVMLLDLAKSLERAGYEEQAKKAVLDYVDYAFKGSKTFVFDIEKGDQLLSNYLKAIKEYPEADQAKFIQKLFESTDFLRLSPNSFYPVYWSASRIFGDQFKGFTPEECEEIYRIFSVDFSHPDPQKLDALFDRVTARLGLDSHQLEKEWNKKQKEMPEFLKLTIREKFRHKLIEVHTSTLRRFIESSGQMVQMIGRWSSPESASARAQVERFSIAITQLAGLSSQTEFHYDEQHSPEKVLESMRQSKGDWWGTPTFLTRSIYTGRDELIYDYLGSNAYFDIGMDLLRQRPDLPEKLWEMASHAERVIKDLNPQQKLAYLNALKECAKAVAARDLRKPGITWGELADSERGRKIVEANHSSFATEISAPEETYLYNQMLGGLAKLALAQDELELKSFGRECLTSMYHPPEEKIDPTIYLNPWQHPYPLQRSTVREAQAGTLINSYSPSDRYFQALSSVIDSISEIQPEDKPLIESFLQAVESPDCRMNRSNLITLYELAYKVVAWGQDPQLTIRVLAIADHPLEQIVKGRLSRAEQLFEHTKRFLEWKKISEQAQGDTTQLQTVGQLFLTDLARDLEGRGRYTAVSLTRFAELVSRLPGTEEIVSQILFQAVERHGKQWGAEKGEMSWQEEWADKIKEVDDVKDFVESVEKLPLSPSSKDEIFSHFVESLSGVAMQEGGVSVESLAVLQGIRSYLKTGRYPKTDYAIYSRTALLAHHFQSKEQEIKTEDALTIAGYFHSILVENPWLQNEDAYRTLAQYHSGDAVYQRSLRALYPEKVALESALLASGQLNITAAAQGNVDPKKFEEAVLEKIQQGSLSNEETTEAISALLKGLVEHSGQSARGGVASLRAAFPVFGNLWGEIEAEFTQTGALCEKSRAILSGIIQGFDGSSIADRALFYAEILQNERIPIEFRREAWRGLVKGRIVTAASELMYERYVQKGEYELSEVEYFKAFGKLFSLYRGKIPPEQAIAVLLANPKESSRYFEALEKWVALKERKSGVEKVDLSNFYDLYFFKIIMEPPDIYTGEGVLGVGITWLYTEKKPFKFNGFAINCIASDSDYLFDYYQGESESSALLYRSTISKAEAINLIEGQKLPPFIENFKPGLRRLFAALFVKMAPGTKEYLFRTFSTLQQQGHSSGEMLRILLETLGWAKVGQILSISPGIPEEWREELAKLQDQVPSSAQEEIDKTLRRDMKEFYDQIESYEYPPIKSGSIGEVLKAKLKDGRQVAIKVITDERKKFVASMFRQQRDALQLLQLAGYEDLEGIKVQDYYSLFTQTIHREMDFSYERYETAEFKNLPEGIKKQNLVTLEERQSSIEFEGSTYTPYTAWHGTSSVLMTEWIEGEKLDPAKITDPVLRERVRNQLEQLIGKPFQDGVYQGDPHLGNFILTSDGTLYMLDFGQVERVSEKTLDGLLDLWLTLSSDSDKKAEKLADALIRMSRTELPKKGKAQVLKNRRAHLIKKIGEILSTQGASPQKVKTLLLLEAAAHESRFKTEHALGKLLKYYSTLEGVLLQLDGQFDLAKSLRSSTSSYAIRRFGKAQAASYVKFGVRPVYKRVLFEHSKQDKLSVKAKEIARRAGAGAVNVIAGGAPFGVGEVGSSLIMSLFSPTHTLPNAEELVKNFGIMSAGAEAGKLVTDGIINKIEGKKLLTPISTKPGEISVKGAARRFFPLLAAMLLDDWIKGRPIEAGKTALGIGNVAIASGITHLVGSGLRKVETVEKLARWLRLVKVGSVAGAPESGGTTILGACVASIVEFTLLKGIGAAEQAFVNYQNKEEVQAVYSKAVIQINDLIQDIKKLGLSGIDQQRIFTARRDLEGAEKLYRSYFISRIQFLEDEREKQRKEIEEDRQAYLIDRGGRSVFEINQMYDEKVAKLNKAFSEEIAAVEGPEDQIQFYRLPLANLYKPQIQEVNMSFVQGNNPPSEKEDEVQDKTQMAYYPFRERLPDTQNAFLAQHEMYLDDLKETLQKALETETRSNPEFLAMLNSSGTNFENFSSESLSSSINQSKM